MLKVNTHVPTNNHFCFLKKKSQIINTHRAPSMNVSRRNQRLKLQRQITYLHDVRHPYCEQNKGRNSFNKIIAGFCAGYQGVDVVLSSTSRCFLSSDFECRPSPLISRPRLTESSVTEVVSNKKSEISQPH